LIPDNRFLWIHCCCISATMGRTPSKTIPWRFMIRSFATVDRPRHLVKVHPLFDWKREQVAIFVREHNVPYNALHDRGFLSIGCAPCTRAVVPGESERAGRWWWERERKKECGLHRHYATALTEHSAEQVIP
jgi:3'-phosphoadenosine 5'-phosphosulfate sulfotransferase (PAPS reductase)/FAD synthetase